MRHHPRVYGAIISVICLLLSFGFTLWYVSKVDNRREQLEREQIRIEREQDQTWCDLLVALDRRNKSIASPNPEQAQFFGLITALLVSQGCT